MLVFLVVEGGIKMLLEEYKPLITALTADVNEIWRRL